jgi:hypothetical protein
MQFLRTTLGATKLSVVVTLLAVTTSSSAAADDAAPASAPPPAPAAAPASHPAGISDDARRHFAAGVALLQDPEGEKVEEAYREFRTAYDLSGSPKILGNMGFCAMRLERDGEAIEAYTRYLREVPDIDPDERAQIVRDVQTLSVGVARLTIEVDKPGARIIDVRIPVRGERVTNTYGPITGKLEIGVRPGHHTITAKLADHEDAMWDLDVFAASKDHNLFTMRPHVVAPIASTTPGSEGGRSSSVGPWVVMGIGGAMLLGGAVTGFVALGKTHDIEAQCPNDVCPKSFDLDGERSSARTFVRLTDVLLIGGGLVTLGGLGWLMLDRRGAESEPPKSARASTALRATPAAGCGPDGCRASLKVVF